MKYVSLFGLLCSIGSTFHLISLSEAQHIICDNQLINVNGDWIGASRDSPELCDQILSDIEESDTDSQEFEVCEQDVDESDGNLGECDTSADDAKTFNCEKYNSGSIEVMSRLDRAIICAATMTSMTGSRDEGGGNTYSPDYDHFNNCLAMEGFLGEERHRIIEWWPPTPSRSPVEAAMLMKERATRELTAMTVCSQLGVEEGDYDPPWNWSG